MRLYPSLMLAAVLALGISTRAGARRSDRRRIRRPAGRTLSLTTEGDRARGSEFEFRSLRVSSARGDGTVITPPVSRVIATVYGRWELIEDR